MATEQDLNPITQVEFRDVYLATEDGKAWLQSLPPVNPKRCCWTDRVGVPCRRKLGHKGLHTWERHAVEHDILFRFLRVIKGKT